ncbi:MAG TPA: DUF5715 family protein [Acidobacteriaceae bacterium]|nr:DUF5715 family protein [Acidobacteriaceae bacterium]
MRRLVLLAMALGLAVPAMSATVSRSSVRHPRTQQRRAYGARAHAVSAHERYLEHLRAERALRLRRAHSESPARIQEIRYRRRAVRASHSGYSGGITRIHWVAPLRGSRASLLRQNERDDAEGLVRIEDEAQLLDLEAAGKLVPIPVSIGLRVNASLPPDRRYCRPWTARFLAALAQSHYARFHRPIEIDSAVRTVSFQLHLERINGNAAPAEGDLASPHLTGAAIDIGKKGMTFSEISWMRGWLLPVQTAGQIDVEEEFHQACFHIDVYRGYDGGPAASHPHSAASLIAAGVN